MKTPQRRFVVEIKSGRRQPEARSNSIWGDTDLKALAREVEEKASHLFTSNVAAGMPASNKTAPADPINAEPAAKERAEAVAISFSNSAQVEISKHHETDHSAEAVVQVQESPPAPQPRTTSVGTPRKRAPAQAIARNSEVGHEDRRAQTWAVDDPISLDELAMLDADNKRLKRLLAKELRAQNLWLKKTLERFDSE